jgi:hypothetical protein
MIITDISYEYDNYSGRNITLRLRDYNGSSPNMSYMVGHDVNITLTDLRHMDLDYKITEPFKPFIEPLPAEQLEQPENSIMSIDL